MADVILVDAEDDLARYYWSDIGDLLSGTARRAGIDYRERGFRGRRRTANRLNGVVR